VIVCDARPVHGDSESDAYDNVIRSASAITASARTQSAAPALAFTCADEVAPAITVATLGRQASHDIASSNGVCPHSVANASSTSHPADGVATDGSNGDVQLLVAAMDDLQPLEVDGIAVDSDDR
jgi:hypothetical protein